MWKLNCEESWAPKNWCFWTVVLEKTLESPLNCREIQPVHSEGDQPCDFFGKNDAKAETPVLWPPHEKSWLIGKDSDAGRDYRQEEKETTEDEMAGWHHWPNGHESEWTLGDGDGQGGLACWNSWGRKESDTTERLNWTELILRTVSLSQLDITLATLFPVHWRRRGLQAICGLRPPVCENYDQWIVSAGPGEFSQINCSLWVFLFSCLFSFQDFSHSIPLHLISQLELLEIDTL